MSIQVEQHLTGLSGLASAIATHNSEHSSTQRTVDAFGALFAGLFEKTSPGERLPEASPQLPDPQKSADAIFKRFSSTLAVLGLELVQNRSRGVGAVLQLSAESFGAEPGAAAGIQRDSDRIELQLVDPAKLTQFLKQVKPGVLERPGMADAFNSLAHSLDQQLIAQWVLISNGEHVPEWKSFTMALEGVTSELNRIGARGAAATLSTHLERTWQGDLTEYLLADGKRLLTQVNFGPQSWHIDSTVEGYQRRWDEAVAVVEKIAENERARDLFVSVSRRLWDNAVLAEEDILRRMQTPAGQHEDSAASRQAFIETVRDAKQRLFLLDPSLGA